MITWLIFTNWAFGLVVWFSLWVREVPSSILGMPHFHNIWVSPFLNRFYRQVSMKIYYFLKKEKQIGSRCWKQGGHDRKIPASRYMRNQVLKEWKILTTCTQATNVSLKYSWWPEATKPPETVPYIKNFKTFASIFWVPAWVQCLRCFGMFLTANLEWKHLQVLFAHVYAYGAGIFRMAKLGSYLCVASFIS
jgi:hypothetical protein